MKRSLLFCFAAVLLISMESCHRDGKDRTSMTKSVFGRMPDGREVHQYTLTNRTGAYVQVITYGAAVRSLCVPDRNGDLNDVVLGYDSLEDYIRDTAYFGAIVGRYANRIAGGRFQLDGKQYQLTVNDGENHLHGGKRGFNKVLWEATILNQSPVPALQLQYVSIDDEEGYPGTVTVKVTYTWTHDNEFRISYEGVTDKPTIFNPSQHSYFNLSGSMTRPILDHLLMIDADSFTPVDRGLIPTGQMMNVTDTPMDFRTPTPIGARIQNSFEQLVFGRGYDHNWILKKGAGGIRKVAELYEPESGRLMIVFTDQPGLQFYSGNFLDGSAKGKNGIRYAHRTGLCLEAQVFPDSPNKPHFPSATLRPGEVYRQTTVYRFSVKSTP